MNTPSAPVGHRIGILVIAFTLMEGVDAISGSGYITQVERYFEKK